MNKGAVEFFFNKGWLQRSLEEGREEPSVAACDTDANRIERIGVETGHGFLYECLALEQSGTDQRPRTGSRLPALLRRGSRMLGISQASDLYLSSSWVITRGTLPISCPPRSSPKIRISSNFAPRVLIRGRQDGENFWKLLSIPIFLHFVTSGSGDKICNVVTVRRVIIQPVDRNWREISKFLIGNGVHSSDRIGQKLI